MQITGEIKVHKSDNLTRAASKVEVMGDGSLAVWDGNTTEPDIIVRPEHWERIEREGHYWRQASPEAIMDRAKERDDVDENEVADQI